MTQNTARGAASTRGFAHADALGLALAGILFLALLTGFTAQSDRDRLFALSTQNMKLIGAAGNLYQAANNNYLPIVLSYTRGFTNRPGQSGSLEGWCTWAYGGKNNSSWWASGFTFDVEAADRPLNTYTNPGQVFFAPAAPARLAANDVHRRKDQASVYRDPSEKASYQRNWPVANSTISTYDDVGTSYLTNAAWFEQVTNPPQFEARFNEGTRRIAAHQGVTPSRFVWLTDSTGDIVTYNRSPSFLLKNNYGEYNISLMTFLDGHVGYHKIFPGPTNDRYRTSEFSMIFE